MLTEELKVCSSFPKIQVLTLRSHLIIGQLGLNLKTNKAIKEIHGNLFDSFLRQSALNFSKKNLLDVVSRGVCVYQISCIYHIYFGQGVVLKPTNTHIYEQI